MKCAHASLVSYTARTRFSVSSSTWEKAETLLLFGHKDGLDSAQHWQPKLTDFVWPSTVTNLMRSKVVHVRLWERMKMKLQEVSVK